MLKELRESSPKYDKAITFILIDWDTYKRDEVTTSLKIPRRSTFVLLKGGNEVGRLVAETSKAEIKKLLEKAF